MKYEHIRGIDKEVSRIVCGCAILPMMKGEVVDDLLDQIYAMGVTTFDTAEHYGLSEISLGHWLKSRNMYDKVVVITKGCHPHEDNPVDRVNPEALKHDLDQSLKRLGTDYIDIYMLHRDDPKVEVGPIVEVLNEYHKSGKIGAFGASNWTHQRIAEANAYAKAHDLVPFTVSSPNFGICNQIDDPWGMGGGCVTISGPSNKEAREWYAENHIPVFAYSSLGRGMFSGRVKSSDMEGAKKILDPWAVKGYCYPENFERLARVEKIAAEKHATVPQVALAWIMSQKNLQVFPLVSAPKAEFMKENIKALDIRLTEEEVNWMDLR